MKKIFKEANNEFEINNDLKTKINSGLGIYQKMMISLFSSTFLGFGSRYGLTLLGEAILTSVGTVGGGMASSSLGISIASSLIGPVGIAIGIGISFLTILGTLIHHYFTKELKYKQALDNIRKEIDNGIDEICKSFEKKMKNFIDSYFNEIGIQLEIIAKEGDKIKPSLWKDIRDEYELRKSKLKEKLESLDYLK